MQPLTLPGTLPLVDAHVHLRNERGLADVAAAGVVAVRDAGSRENAAAGISAAIASSLRPKVVSSGWALFREGGYGSRMGVPVASGDDILREISRLAAAGVGIIKAMASGAVSLRQPGAITPGGFGPEEMRLIVCAARDHGLGVMAHANGEEAIIAAAAAGVLSVEHGFFMTGRALDALARKRVFWVPTVGALQRAADGPDVTPDARTFVRRLVEDHCSMVGRAQAEGVPLAVGTDAVLPHPGYRVLYEQELAYFSQAGIPRDDVIAIATDGGAKLLGR